MRKVLAGCLCASVAAAPAVAYAATNDETNTETDVTIVRQADSQIGVRHDARLKLNMAEERVERVKRVRRKRVERKRARRLAKRQAATAATTASGTAPSANLQAIAACESGGDPTAVGGGAYRGKYQFDYGTWASVGGSGDPAAAPEAEQDMRAQMLYERSGSSPWPVCGQ